MKDRLKFLRLGIVAAGALTLASCGGADTNSNKIQLPPPAATSSSWPNLDRDTQVIGTSIKCDSKIEEDRNPKTEETFLYPDQSANIKGFIIKPTAPGEIRNFDGTERNGKITDLIMQPGKTIIGVNIDKVQANIVALKVTPNNAVAGTLLTAKLKCIDPVGPNQQ